MNTVALEAPEDGSFRKGHHDWIHQFDHKGKPIQVCCKCGIVKDKGVNDWPCMVKIEDE